MELHLAPMHPYFDIDPYWTLELETHMKTNKNANFLSFILLFYSNLNFWLALKKACGQRMKLCTAHRSSRSRLGRFSPILANWLCFVRITQYLAKKTDFFFDFLPKWELKWMNENLTKSVRMCHIRCTHIIFFGSFSNDTNQANSFNAETECHSIEAYIKNARQMVHWKTFCFSILLRSFLQKEWSIWCQIKKCKLQIKCKYNQLPHTFPPLASVSTTWYGTLLSYRALAILKLLHLFVENMYSLWNQKEGKAKINHLNFHFHASFQL